MTRRFDLLLETPPLPPPGSRVKRRLAVRAVIERAGRLLLVRSGTVGDWKFPGGGVKPGEEPQTALRREVREETGFACRSPFVLAGRVVERAPGRDIPGSLFEMESRYFHVAVSGEPGPLDLDAYERDLGFEPLWIEPHSALTDNRVLLAAGGELPPWLTREIRVLEWLVDSGA